MMFKPRGITMVSSTRNSDKYQVSPEAINFYRTNGFLVLENILLDSELEVLEKYFDRFTLGEIPGMEKDLCDMSGNYDDEFQDYALVNAMLPRVYLPELKNNIYERLSQSIANQLMAGNAALDYDQFLAKKPNHPRAKFAWHQDMGYWPMTKDTRTATFSLALSDSTRENGCIRFIPRSHKEKMLYPHRPVAKEQSKSHREDSHSLELQLSEKAEIHYVPVKRGSVTIHDEWIVHGSSGNESDQWRKTYIVAYRTRETVHYERSIGFTHSHNDKVNWKSTLELEYNSKD